ncbi:MAG: DUF493 family protein [Nannocystaceae bacterium]|nr:DUF493 family protein [Nannocystaceae bacterium]
MDEPRSKAPSRELLLANHVFPGEYIVKAFGPGTDDFRGAIRSAAVVVVGEERASFTERASRHGAKVCITLTLNAETVDEVIDVYERIHTVGTLALIL